MLINCPLCRRGKPQKIESIMVSDLVKLYTKMFSKDISEEFGEHDEIGFYSCEECGLKYFYPAITGSEKFYELLQRFDWYYLDEKSEYDYAIQFIKKSDSVLEIGCGKGAFAKKIKTIKYTGLEASNSAIKMAEREGIHVLNEPIQEHANNYQESYDVVCFFQVLEHVSDLYDFLSSSIKCVKPDGLLIVSVPSADSFISLTVNNILNTPPHHITWWTDKSLHSISDIFGIELVKLEHEKLADIHRGWYASTVTLNAINAVLKRSPKLIDISISGRIISKFAWILGQFYVLGIIDTKMRPHGHSVNVVYRKGTNGHR